MIEEQKGIAEAESLLEDLGFDSLPIIPQEVVSAINCDDFTVVLEPQNFSSQKILGKALGNSQGALIYINSNIPDIGRLNFTVAHEIGHVCMHIMERQRMQFECGNEHFSSQYNDPIEQQANGFASGLLMPKRLFAKLTDNDMNWSNIKTISDHCQSSLQATFRRISKFSSTPSALVIHKNGNFKSFIASDNFNFFIEKSPLSTEQKVCLVDMEHEAFPADFDQVDAADWVNPASKGEKLNTIYNSSILLKEGFSYSLLTYDDDCLEDTEY